MTRTVTIFKDIQTITEPFYRPVEFILNRIKEGASSVLVKSIRKETDKEKPSERDRKRKRKKRQKEKEKNRIKEKRKEEKEENRAQAVRRNEEHICRVCPCLYDFGESAFLLFLAEKGKGSASTSAMTAGVAATTLRNIQKCAVSGFNRWRRLASVAFGRG